mmetsp:Transcript_166674/g.529685  ORF Transcript_166674/g.529685 Transcript_166674/m.529685 type:complete len:660 (+) Transcript_166674:51-2030(+)
MAALNRAKCFRVVVHEAMEVPECCKTLTVAWRKGIKEVSTGPADVVDGRASFDRPLSLSCALLQAAGSATREQARYETKFCWLEVSRDGGDVVGHAQLDLADFCDGRVHRLCVSIQARGPSSASSMAAAALAASPPRLQSNGLPVPAASQPRELEGDVEQHTPSHSMSGVVAVDSAPAFVSAVGSGILLGTLSTVGSRMAAPGRVQASAEGSVAAGVAAVASDDGGGGGRVSTPSATVGPWAGPGPSGVVAGAIGDSGGGSSPSALLPAVLVESNASMHSASALPPAGASFGAAALGGDVGAGSGSVVRPRVDIAVLAGAVRAEAGAVAAFRAQEAAFQIDVASHFAASLEQLTARLLALCKRQCLASGLTSVQREDALRIFVAALQQSQEPSSACGILFSSSPRMQTLDGGFEPVAVDAAGLSTGYADAPAELQEQEILPLPSCLGPVVPGLLPSAVAAAAAAAAATDGAPRACTRHVYDVLSHLSDIRSLTLLMSTTDALSPPGEDIGLSSLSASPASQTEAFALDPMIAMEGSGSISEQEVRLVVSQILAGIDLATSSGERALKEVGASFRELLVQLHEVSQERELWMHRFLGARELQYSAALCARAAHLFTSVEVVNILGDMEAGDEQQSSASPAKIIDEGLAARTLEELEGRLG